MTKKQQTERLSEQTPVNEQQAVDLEVQSTDQRGGSDFATPAKPVADEQAEIDRVIKDHNGDGPGDLDNLPDSDFEGFPEEGVLKDEVDGR